MRMAWAFCDRWSKQKWWSLSGINSTHVSFESSIHTGFQWFWGSCGWSGQGMWSLVWIDSKHLPSLSWAFAIQELWWESGHAFNLCCIGQSAATQIFVIANHQVLYRVIGRGNRTRLAYGNRMWPSCAAITCDSYMRQLHAANVCGNRMRQWDAVTAIVYGNCML